MFIIKFDLLANALMCLLFFVLDLHPASVGAELTGDGHESHCLLSTDDDDGTDGNDDVDDGADDDDDGTDDNDDFVDGTDDDDDDDDDGNGTGDDDF